MSRDNTGNSARLKRFESDLKRKLPVFPISISETSLSYSDLLKLQKRANEIGISPTFPNERYLWVLKVLNNLEKWAAHIIPVNQAESVKDTIAYLKAAEQQFGLSFMRSVPLYKAIKSANRKFIQIIQEYETEREDDWVPKSVASLPIHYLEKIVSETDLDRVVRINTVYNEIVDNGYFSPTASLSALSLLGSFHPHDLKSSALFPLLPQISLSIPSAPPCFVHVDSRIVSLLLCIVILSNMTDSATPKFLRTISRTLDDRINDPKFKRAAEPFLANLSIKVFPQAVLQLEQLLRGKYGHRTVRKAIRNTSEQPYRPFTGSGMTTRQRQRQREQSTKIHLFISPARKILKLVSEGTKLAKHDSSGTIELAIENLRSIQIQLRQEEIEMTALLARADVRSWELGKLVPWTSSDVQFHLYPLRSALEQIEKELVKKISTFKFNRNIIFYRKFIDAANEEISLIRGIRDLVEWSLDTSSVPLGDIESVLARFSSPPPQSLGIVRIVHEALVGIRDSLKALSKKDYKSVFLVQRIFESIHSPPSVALPFEVDVSACDSVVDAKNFLDSLTHLQIDVSESAINLDDFDSLNHQKLGQIWTELYSLLMAHKFTLDDPTSLDNATLRWWDVCFLSNWFVKAHSLVNSNSVSDLIALHQELANSGLRDRIFSENFHAIASAVDERIERVQSVIDRLDNGENIEKCLAEVSNVTFSVIDNYRMFWEDYLSAQYRLGHYVEIIDSMDPPSARCSIASVRETVTIIEDFESKFPENRIDNESNFLKISQLVKDAGKLELVPIDRASTESVLAALGRKFTSPEFERVAEILTKVQKLEIEIGEICKKEPGLKIGTSESPSQSFSRIFDLVLAKYDLIKKIGKSKIGVLESVQVRLSFSVFTSLTVLLRIWTQHKRDLDFSTTPRWLVLYMLRTLGAYIGTNFKSLCPKNFPSNMDWLTKQLNASNEVLKEAKKSIADFARNRFMIPMFHFALYEPMEKIRKNFESKIGVNVKMYYKENLRQLDFICTLNPSNGKVIDRFFPKLGTPQTSLIEPETSGEISTQFEQREIPKSLPDVLSQLQILVKFLREDVKHAKMVSVIDSRSSTPPPDKSSKQPMSFTKFLSSSFANLSLETPSGIADDGNAKSSESLNDYWINNVDQIVGTSESSFFEKYLDLIEESKRARNEVVDLTPHPVTTPATTVTVAPPKPPPIAPPMAPPPPGFGARSPPSASPKNDKGFDSDKLVIWEGRIEGGSKNQNLSFDVCLVPFFRAMPSADLENLEHVLRGISSFTLEGTMGIGKFSDYYQKLTLAANRKRREPYNFLLALKDSRFDMDFFHAIPMNTANALAVMIGGQKMKLWTLSVDGVVDYKPLPVLPGVVFGMLEMPPTVFSPSTGFVENIHHPLEMNHLISNLNNQIEKSGKSKSLYVSLSVPTSSTMQPQSTGSQGWLPPPTGPMALAVPKPTGDFLPVAPPIAPSATTESLARVYDLISQESKAPPPPVYNPYVGSVSTVRPSPASTTSWARPNIVIGAPSTGPSLNELPNPRKGSCRFFNTAQGCQQGKNCKFTHLCSVCGDENHNAIEHYARPHH